MRRRTHSGPKTIHGNYNPCKNLEQCAATAATPPTGVPSTVYRIAIASSVESDVIVSIVGIGPFANLGSDDRNGGGSACEKAPFVIVYYAKGVILLTKCGLEAVDREVASAILVVKVQCADPLCNATLGVQW